VIDDDCGVIPVGGIDLPWSCAARRIDSCRLGPRAALGAGPQIDLMGSRERFGERSLKDDVAGG
jgi:hypothetical protein